MTQPLLSVRGLRTYVYSRRGIVKAVDGVDFDLASGEVLGVVGESGSGKTMVCLSILRLLPTAASRIVGGRIVFDGTDLLGVSERAMRRYRGRRISMVLQDPASSLDPAMRIGRQIGEALSSRTAHGETETARVERLLGSVGIPDPSVRRRNYPHQLSGGMRQRAASAVAIGAEPSVLIADEPTTSLDMTVQAQYLTMLRDLQARTGMAIIFVTHDLGIVANLCDRVAVMYAGRIVEQGLVRDVFRSPAHPYTQALLESLPRMDEPRDRLVSIPGEPPDPRDLPPGCAFHPRCPIALDVCANEYPAQTRVGDDHTVRCWAVPDDAGYDPAGAA